jgi:Tat protein secretion system quality control protein TatD with DNase activity
MNNYIVDTHCHLDLIEKQGAKIEEIIENSLQNNVKILQTICTRITEIEKILSYTKLYDFIYASVGVHPCNVLEQPKYTAEEIIKNYETILTQLLQALYCANVNYDIYEFDGTSFIKLNKVMG